MKSPSGYVHYEPCDLPLCSLRQDLVAFKEDQKQRKPRKQLGGQLDGAALSLISRSSPVEGRSSDDESTTINVQKNNEADGEPQMLLVDPSSRVLNGLYSDSSEFGSDASGEEAAMEVNAVSLQHSSTEPQGANSTTSTPPPTVTNMDYFDLSNITPSPPSPDREETPLLSLNHPGTLCKRKKTTSPKQQESPSNKRQKGHLKGTHTSCDPLLVHGNSLSLSSPSIPEKPRALGGVALICFYWYHKGHCHPKRRRNGMPTKCTYAHTLDMPVTEVSLPPMIGDHPDCSLPLCPLRSAGGTQDAPKPKEDTNRPKETLVKNHPATPPRHSNAMNGYSSSSRDSIADVRYLVKGRKHLQLPKLTGANRTRFKAQRRAVENWQADNGVKHLKTDRQVHEEKQMRKQHKREKRMKRLRTDNSVLNYSDAGPKTENVVPDAIAVPAQTTVVLRERRQQVPAENNGAMKRFMTEPRVLVDYGLPMGDDRLDWDTDRVRSLFGEIE
jgi:hypothetical protein